MLAHTAATSGQSDRMAWVICACGADFSERFITHVDPAAALHAACMRLAQHIGYMAQMTTLPAEKESSE